MDWVNGLTMGNYIRQNIHDKYALELLAYNFSRMAMWLLPQPFAHGDLKPDNIMVRPDGSLTLVDYDGMYVPSMQGEKSHELGSPDFRHPLRTENDFNERIDDFSAISILLSLRLIAYDPSLFNSHESDRLLFCEKDYRELSSCAILKSAFPSQNTEINTLISLFTIAHTNKTLSNISFRLLSIVKPQKQEIVEEILSTEVTEDDLENAIVDEFGVMYSKDMKRLLKGTHLAIYKIKEGTNTICNYAFSGFHSLQKIILPSSITSIGDGAFWGCSLKKITIPSSVTKIGDEAFTNNSLTEIIIPSSVTEIGNRIFAHCKELQMVTIPTSLTRIENGMFECCESLKKIIIPLSIKSIGDSAFSWCNSLQEIVIPKSIKKIGINPFIYDKCRIINQSSFFTIKDDVLYNSDMTKLISFHSKLTYFTIPLSVKAIGDRAFWGRESLSLCELTISEGVIHIGDSAFWGCISLKEIIIPKTVTRIGICAFLGCTSLKKVTISLGVENIGSRAFENCSLLQDIMIPSSTQKIEDETFIRCVSLTRIKIPFGVTHVGKKAFADCSSLQEIILPESITYIGNRAFSNCDSLQKIIIPQGSKAKFEHLLSMYKDILVEMKR